jgi:hypothetical protein
MCFWKGQECRRSQVWLVPFRFIYLSHGAWANNAYTSLPSIDSTVSPEVQRILRTYPSKAHDRVLRGPGYTISNTTDQAL